MPTHSLYQFNFFGIFRGHLSDDEDADDDVMETETRQQQFEPGPGTYSLIFRNNTFYVFLRLHQVKKSIINQRIDIY